MISQIQAQSGIGLLCLIAVFFYVGLITIGGGQVAITVMQQVLVEDFHLMLFSSIWSRFLKVLLVQ